MTQRPQKIKLLLRSFCSYEGVWGEELLHMSKITGSAQRYIPGLYAISRAAHGKAVRCPLPVGCPLVQARRAPSGLIAQSPLQKKACPKRTRYIG